ncbi:MAG: hypothetical protein JXC85_00670 [Candidatus Aenigmarchaeota archaeon]|nr:hypothetical protein [Candidatus Aenigmarchaeota archaeon]
MNRAETTGVLLVSFAIVILAGYALYLFVQASEVPAVIRLGVVALVIGFLVILISVIRERLIDLRKEKSHR